MRKNTHYLPGLSSVASIAESDSGKVGKTGQFPPESVVNLPRNGWSDSSGIGGQFAAESVVSLDRNTQITEALEAKLLSSKDDGEYIPYNQDGDFGSTLEWFVAAIFVLEFSCMAYWGVKLKDVGSGGDYDVIVSREGAIGYIECKSGQWSNIKPEHVKEFLDRERSLSPNFSIFLADDISRENLDKLVEYAFKELKEYEYEVPGMMDTSIELEKEVYKNFIRLIPINCFFITSEGSIIERFREILKFLTLVHDRSMPFENIAAKKQFESIE